ncbi:hypothetical protein Tco_0011096, partial [Tanacetum coccineum]
DMSYHHHSSVSSARLFNVSGDMLLIPSFSIKKLNLSLGKGLVKMSANPSWPTYPKTIMSSRRLWRQHLDSIKRLVEEEDPEMEEEEEDPKEDPEMEEEEEEMDC